MAVAIFKGTFAKILASAGILFKGGNKIINGSADPSLVATEANKGSLYISTNGNVYRKTDNGSSTNWVIVASNVSQVVRVGGAGADYATIADFDLGVTDNGPLKQYVALLSPIVFPEPLTMRPFIAYVGVGNGSSTPLITGKITATGFPVGYVATLNRIGQSYTVASDGEVCNDWASPVLANDCFFDFNIANDYGFTGIRQSCADSPVNQVVSVLSFISCTSTYDGSTKDITAYEATGNGAGNGMNQVEIRINAKASSGELIPRKLSSTGTAPATFQGCLIKVNNVKAASTATCCIHKTSGASTGPRGSSGDQIQVTGNLASCNIYCMAAVAEFDSTGCSVAVASTIPIVNITNTIVSGTQKVWLASTNRLMTKSGNGLAIVTPLDLVNTGFVEWSTVGATYWSSSYDAPTNVTTFTVDKRGSGLVKSSPVVWAAGQSVALTDSAVNYIYSDSTGVIRAATTTSDGALYRENIVLFEVLSESGRIVVANDAHPVEFTTAVSIWAHRGFRSFLESGSQSLTVTTPASRQINIVGTNTILDHGLYQAVAAQTPASWIMYGRRKSDGRAYRVTTATSIPTYFDSSIAATSVNAGSFVVGRCYEIRALGSTDFTLIGALTNTVGACFTTTGVGSGTGTAWQLTDDAANGDWFVFRLGCIKSTLNASGAQFVCVLDDGIYGSQTAARNAIAAGTIVAFPSELLELETSQLGFAIIQGNGPGGNGASGAVTPVTALQVQGALFASGGTSTAGSLITLDPTNFAERLSGTESNGQAMADRLDDYSHTPDWVATVSTYRVRDKVVRYGGIYRCTVAHTASAAFGTDIAKWEQLSTARFADVTAAQAAFGNDNELCYVVSTETFYRNEASGSAFTANSTFVLTTGAGGNTRWIGVAGQYVNARKLGELTATISSGNAIDLSSTTGPERWYAVIGNAAGGNNMSATPFGASAPAETMTVWLVGRSSDNTVTLATNDAARGAFVTGGFIELGKGTAVCFKYSPTLARWIELSRNNYSM